MGPPGRGAFLKAIDTFSEQNTAVNIHCSMLCSAVASFNHYAMAHQYAMNGMCDAGVLGVSPTLLGPLENVSSHQHRGVPC